ncbi:MAG: ATP-binding cassette domain-containing protein [Deltaproteobacteria bacterium]|nr:ATP-binding cassette domain-containing protein [Deltaproteobacteria bacterium]
MTAAHPVARTVGLAKAFGAHQVLAGVTLELSEGRCTFVAGPSGTGKSVLVRHLVGLLKPDAGEVWYKDLRVDVLDEEALLGLRRRCVYVFQHPTLFDSMTVTENVALVVKYHKGVKAAAAEGLARAQLDRMGLSRLAESRPPELPAGEQKLVSLARALALEPETLILDEPTTGLDPYAAFEIDAHVRRLKELGVTLLVISHDLQSIRRLADEVVFLFDRKVRYEGGVDGFFHSADPVLDQFVHARVEGEI